MAQLAHQQFWSAIQDLEDFYEKTKDLENAELSAPNGKPMSWLQKIQWTSNTEIRLWARLEKLANVASHKVHPSSHNKRDEIEAGKDKLAAMEALFESRRKEFEARQERKRQEVIQAREKK